MRGQDTRPGKTGRWVLAAWLLIAVAAVAGAIPGIDSLGLYYDEAFLAQQARDFVEPETAAEHPASVRSLEILGRSFPVRNAVYLGSLKSQLLIPALAAAGSSPRVLRIATLLTGLLALLFAMLWAERVFGRTEALLMGLLVASDPAFYFLAQFEWGPFTTNFLCRAGGALLIVLAWQSASTRRALGYAVAGGGVLGLGVFSRADFILIPAAAGLALALCHPDLVREALARRRLAVAAAAAAFLLAALPMIASVWALLDATGATASRGDLLFRSQVLWQSLDGSHFLRLMESGGRFETTPGIDAPGGLLGWWVVAGALLLAAGAIRRRRHAETAPDPRLFLVVLAALLTGAMLALPGAVRAHHQLNALPLLHLIVACAAVDLWRRPTGHAARWVRGAVALALAGVLAGNLLLIERTSRFIEETGGRGRWSHALDEFAARANTEPGSTVVSLNWGFHEPLAFLTRRVRVVETIWTLPQAAAAGRPWTRDAEAGTTYLVHDAPYDLFGLGPRFLLAARIAGDQTARIEAHRDGAGDVAFYSVRMLRAHRLRYDGRFRIE